MAQQPLPLPELANPAAISPWWPLAPGWWLLIIITLVVILTAVFLLYRRYRRNRYRRAALIELQQLQLKFEQQALSLEQLCQQSNALLKRTALACYGSTVASLTGQQWLHFMQHHTDFDDDNKTIIEQLIAQQYQPQITLEPTAIFAVCQQFIARHRFAKSSAETSNTANSHRAVVK